MGTFCSNALADDYKLNVCEYFFKDAWRPSTYITLKSCRTGAFCVLNPMCCIPTVCLTNPTCIKYEKVFTEDAMDLLEDGELVCNYGWVDEKYLLWLVMGGTLGPGGNAIRITDIASTAIHLHISILENNAKKLRSSVAGILKDLVALRPEAGITNEIIDGVKIISSNDPTAGLYVFGDRNALTFGNTIILKNNIFTTLDKSASVSLRDIQTSPGLVSVDFLEAISIMAHELVHVVQYHEMGKDDFISDYVLQTGFADSCENSLEVPAYRYEFDLANSWGGPYCNGVAGSLQRRDNSCGSSFFTSCQTAVIPPQRGGGDEGATGCASETKSCANRPCCSGLRCSSSGICIGRNVWEP